jgi:hemoglobin
MKRDIATREDLFALLHRFYDKLLIDETIAYIFTDVAQMDTKKHIPVIVDFWDMVLFQSPRYKKNAIEPHLVLNQKSKFEKHHFETWLRTFNETVDELFDGTVAFSAKQKAKSIATIMQIKIAQMNKSRLSS